MDPTAPAQRRWRLADLSISVKLNLIVTALVAVVLVTLATILAAFQLTAGVRAYVGGEGLWSKAQKDAAYHLARYADDGQTDSYLSYRQAIEIPLAIRRAREEMNQEHFNPQRVHEEFVRSGIHVDDVPHMIRLYRHFGWVSYLAEAIGIWEQADQHIEEIVALATQLLQAHQAGSLGIDERRRLIAELNHVNAVLTPLELRFSEVLGEGARWLRNTLLVAIVGISGGLLLGALLLSRRLGQDVHKQVLALKAGAARVAAGTLDQPIPVPSRDELGELAQAFNAMALQRQSSEQKMEKDSEFLRALLENLSEGIVACDAQGTLTLFNRATRNFHGIHEESLPPEQWAGRYSLYRADGRNPLPTEEIPLYRALHGERLRNVEIVIAPADAPARTVSCSGRALLGSQGQTLGAVVAMHDVTEQQANERALRQHAAELARSNAELQRFAYIASHDLQEPLRTVSSYTQLLLRRLPQNLDEDQKLFADQIRSGIGRMKDLIEGLLEYSRVSRPAQVVAVDLNTVCENALANLGHAVQSSGAVIMRGPLPTVPGSARQLTQVLQNLIGNAIKFSGKQTPKVQISAKRGEEGWTLVVRDHGMGIEAPYREQIFGLFKRLHTSDEIPGSGVGLTICRRVIEQHGGRIWVEAAEPGTRFHLLLPDFSEKPVAIAAQSDD